MAAGAWTFYNEAKKYLMTGDIDLNATGASGTPPIRMGLYTSASNAATATLSTKGSLTNEVAEFAGAYSSSGKPLTGVTWTAVPGSAAKFRLDATAVVWSATSTAISAIKFAVLWYSGGKLLCYSQLSTSQFNVTIGNTLTITPSANGIFELV